MANHPFHFLLKLLLPPMSLFFLFVKPCYCKCGSSFPCLFFLSPLLILVMMLYISSHPVHFTSIFSQNFPFCPTLSPPFSSHLTHCPFESHVQWSKLVFFPSSPLLFPPLFIYWIHFVPPSSLNVPFRPPLICKFPFSSMC